MSKAPDLEKLRPFVRGLAQPTRSREYMNGGGSVPAETTTEADETPTLTWSARASVQTTTLPFLGVILPDDSADEDGLNGEVNRLTHIVRLYSEGDPDTYIDFEIPDEITFKNNAQRERKFTFNS